ncbi:MAG: aminopeptidase P family protein [Clostridia bacterium]|nr:aminopeptidase P family protein [Clostridia bacterium]
MTDFLKNELKAGEAFLISSPENRRYYTDFEASDGYLLVTPKKAVLFADGRYIEAAQGKAKNCDEVRLLKKVSEDVKSALEAEGITKVYTEEEKLTLREFKALEKAIELELAPEKTDELTRNLRRKKSLEEKERIIKAQRIAEGAFEHILSFIKEGVTEKEIRLELEFYMLKNGADGLSFETIAISGKNTSMPHGVPTGKPVEKGDFITMDYGALYRGYHSDMTRTVALGYVRDEQEKVYNTVLEAQKAAIEAVIPGAKCAGADAAARQIIEKAGYAEFFTHGTGHGVGIDIHEPPTVSYRSEETLRPGDVVTAEPGIYLPGKFGVRIEDMLYVTENSAENLTEAPRNLIVL